ncbi:MAG TPA: hypothetical protein GXZ24_09055 [Firmicutes bacterium]|nr:hypothetical protein [Bacillota bacterium]
MEEPIVFRRLKPYIDNVLKDPVLSGSSISITCKTLTPEEAIGNPGRDDFPLQKGKEKLMQAVIDGFAGQAFTDMPGNFEGSLKDALTLPPDNNYNRAVIIAALNALCSKRGEAGNTIHCKDEAPGLCSQKLVETISKEYGQPRIAVIGLQPAMVEELARHFELRVFDLDPDNIGQKKYGVTIEDGEQDLAKIEDWCDLLLVTGSTSVNGSIDPFLDLKKPVIFYGTTVAAVAGILQLNRYCPLAK